MRNRVLLGMLVSVGLVAMGRFATAADRNAPPPIKAFCIDFNWGPKGINGFAGPGVWADASPEEHVRWYEGLGANVIQTFAVSCNGYAWYKDGLIPPQPGLKFDFLTDLVRLGHAKGMRVMGYYCVGANTLWGQKHPEFSYGTPGAPHIPLTTAYLDYLCGSMEDALKRTGIDGFMIDWVWNPSQRTLSPEKNAREQWLECEKNLYAELMGQPFPGERHLSPSDKLAYERKSLDHCWTRIHAAAKRANPNCVIWLSCNDLKHPTVIDSKMFREIDWLMNEHPDPAGIVAVAKMAGPQTQLVQCLVGWGDQHDAKKVLENPEFRKLGIYGFAKPGENSLPLPISQYTCQDPKAFKGNDKNIAVLLRYFHGLPLDHVDQSQHPVSQSLKPGMIGSQVASGSAPPFPIQRVPAPLFDDPLWHGAADPTVIWNPVQREWWVYYTQRRAALKNPKGVDWCHGSAIGIATSKDGVQWNYGGICTGDEGLGSPLERKCSWWAPCVMFHDGQFHLFVACVDGIYTEWTGKRAVKHFTSQDGKTWKYQMTLPLSSDNCIDPCIYRIGDKWLVWYKDEGHGSKTYAAESPDLKNWKVIGSVITDVSHEAPLVWRWKRAYWMIVDAWAEGLRIYRSGDGISDWRYNSTILLAPGKRAKDSVQGGHPYVLEQGDRAIVFYHVHYAHGRETVLQAAELEMDAEGKVVCDRDKYVVSKSPAREATTDAPRPWPVDKARRWYKQQPWICGFNYIPATAINYTEMWQKETFDPKTIDEELVLAEQIRFNSLRCVLQYLVWEHDPDGFKQRLDQFLAICHKRGIRVVLCLFDDCVFGPKHDPYLGKQADVVLGWYAHDWSPSPGWSRVKDPKTWPKLRQYVQDVLTKFKDDPRVLMWDLYNEPTNGIGDATLPLLTRIVEWARQVNPPQPLTVGMWNENRKLNDLAVNQSDVITFHRYSNAAQLEEFIRALEKYDRPMVCTEWFKRDWGSVADQLPVFIRHRVGCLHWGLVNGKTQTQYPWGSKAGALEPKVWQHDLFRKDRTPYDPNEIELFKQAIARSQHEMPGSNKENHP